MASGSMRFMTVILQCRFLIKRGVYIFPINIVSFFLDLVKKLLLKHWDRKNKFRIFSIRYLNCKINPAKAYFFNASIAKIYSAIIYDRRIFCS